jgi:hypothetical protein
VVVLLVGGCRRRYSSEKSDGKRHSGSWDTRTSLSSTSKRGGMVQAAGAKAVAAAAGSRPYLDILSPQPPAMDSLCAHSAVHPP